MSRNVSSYDYVQFVDSMIAKEWILGNFGSEPIIWEDYHYSVSSCCGKPCFLRTLSFGRFIGQLEICDHCLEIEKQFVDSLLSFDETEDLIMDEGLVDTRSMSPEQMESLKRYKRTKEEKKRSELEKLGQGRLF